MTISIIIAVKTWQKNLEECVAKCRELDFSEFEILIFPDAHIEVESLSGAIPVKVIPTGQVSPAHKRDIALNYAKGEILAFLDDDAYPVRDWLKNAVKDFDDPNVAAVCGPAITPDSDTIRQQASGLVFSSFLVSGKFSYRYLPGKLQEVDDYPSCNFLVRKSIMQELGGFNTNFWPGEDTKLCLDITKKLGKKIIYDPAVLVYHHRRTVFSAHLKQVAAYALHRGYFVKKYPQTSLRPAYFLPSIFVIGFIAGGNLSLFLDSLTFSLIYFLGICSYLVLVFLFSFSKDLRLFYYVFLGIILTHFIYGIYFLNGLFTGKLAEEK